MIAVTGATGTVGSALVNELLERGVRPRAIVRPGRDATGAGLSEAERVEVDLERPETLRGALAGVRRLFLLTPLHPRQDALQRSIVAAAAEAAIEHVVKISALGADPRASARIQRQHGCAEADLVESGMAYTLLRCNAFMQNALQWRAMIVEHGAITMPVGAARVSMIDARDVAAVGAEALTTDGMLNRAYDLTGPEALSYADAAACLSAATGRSIRHVDVDTATAAHAMRAAGMPAWAVDARLELYATYRAGEASRVTSAVHDLTRSRPRRFAALAREIADRLRP